MEERKPMVVRGRARVVAVDDVDTDMIFHNKHLHITDRAEMGKHIFGNLPGWEAFPREARTGDILVVGHNFGCGSSRQQAVDGLLALGVAALTGRSFGAIYKRNAINAGLPLLECPEIIASGIKDGDEVEVDLSAGVVRRSEGGELARGKPMSGVARDIYQAGGLMELAKSSEQVSK
jgi:3-isopropylmalate/(R)-2-methylmalate dehydratase small subunit